jgi:TatD DNase family protein
MWTDAHCHLEEETYGALLPQVLARARTAGVTRMIAVGASRVADGAREAVALAAQHPDVYATCGIHPHDAARADDDAFVAVERLLSGAVAVGEVGLDYYYDHAPRDLQRRVFKRFLHLARKTNLPIMLHVRDAHQDCCLCVDEVGLPARGGVVHCFSAGAEEAHQYLLRGMLLSIPGIVTFKKATALQDAVRMIPADRLLVETDCPYLAPVPMRGQRNEPSFLVHTGATVAALRDVSVEELARTTSANATRFYGLNSP